MPIVVQDVHRAAVLVNYRIARRDLRKNPLDAIAWVQDVVYGHATARELAAGNVDIATRLAAYFAAAEGYKEAARRLRNRRIDRIVGVSS